MVPFLNLKTQYHQIKQRVDAAVLRVMDSGQFVLGPEVEAFERKFAAYCQSTHCCAVNSGTSALHLALLAAGIGPGDEIITVSMTFVATTAAIVYCGARPIYVDVDPATWTLDPEKIASAITERTKAIVPVHLHGVMADMDPIMEIARRHRLLVIEDAAQAHGAEYKGRRAGSIGELGCFSFYPGKNLGAYGEGGAVVTSDPELARKITLLRDWGQEARYHHVVPGFNYRMDAIQAAILNVKMDYIEEWTAARRSAAAHYDMLLAPSPFRRPSPPAHSRHVYHVYAIVHPRRDEAIKALQMANIGVGIHYPIPVHRQKAYSSLAQEGCDLPVTDALAAGFLSLPIYPELESEQAVTVARVIENTAFVQAA